MAHSLVFAHEALRELKKLENKEAKRIVEKLKESAKEPNAFFERLVGREEYKLRVGDYRVIANILNKEKKIVVRSVGHRKNIYRR
ncbi:type II toxin-antitoxin system RelE/ParE family toxin [Candidatus Micrarchaeota archaeon]|nr:type II toxin-antitoxin system RelE/ParE family toxin [Candidatus Micrarchaeota archaeon]